LRHPAGAAYKGVNALLMKEGALDFRSGQKFDHIVFFGENVPLIKSKLIGCHLAS
jgi:hypothetical protein